MRRVQIVLGCLIEVLHHGGEVPQRLGADAIQVTECLSKHFEVLDLVEIHPCDLPALGFIHGLNALSLLVRCEYRAGLDPRPLFGRFRGDNVSPLLIVPELLDAFGHLLDRFLLVVEVGIHSRLCRSLDGLRELLDRGLHLLDVEHGLVARFVRSEEGVPVD